MLSITCFSITDNQGPSIRARFSTLGTKSFRSSTVRQNFLRLDFSNQFVGCQSQALPLAILLFPTNTTNTAGIRLCSNRSQIRFRRLAVTGVPLLRDRITARRRPHHLHFAAAIARGTLTRMATPSHHTVQPFTHPKPSRKVLHTASLPT